MKLDTVKDIAENLDEIHIFADLSQEDLEKVANFCTPRTYPKNSMIILEEEFGDTVFGINYTKLFNLSSYYFNYLHLFRNQKNLWALKAQF